MDKPLWGKKIVKADFPTHAGAHTHEVQLLPKGRLDHGFDSHLKGLNWHLKIKDVYSNPYIEFKIGKSYGGINGFCNAAVI